MLGDMPSMEMKQSTIISLDRPGRLLKKSEAYLSDINIFLEEIPASITILLDTLALADSSLTARILPLLGSAGRDRVLRPLFHVMMDSSAREGVRRLAAMQLGLAASLSEDPSALNADLIENLDHSEPLVRASCALALGWEGNARGVAALMSHLQDPDRDVQAAVAAALSSINDGRVFDYLIDRLKNGTLEEQRSIVLNLWRFSERRSGVETVYLNCLDWLPDELVSDILSAVSMIPHTPVVFTIYRRMLSVDDLKIRLQVLENLEALDPLDYQSLNNHLYALLTDRETKIRQAATRLLAKSVKC